MQRRMFIGLYTCPCRKKTERRFQIELDKNIYEHTHIYIYDHSLDELATPINQTQSSLKVGRPEYAVMITAQINAWDVEGSSVSGNICTKGLGGFGPTSTVYQHQL